MTALPDLIGAVHLRPGQRPAIASTRPDLAPRVLAGAPLAEVLPRIGALFTLCGAAHRLAAREALAAAGAPLPGDEEGNGLVSLRLSTAREHVIRIGHDWARLAGIEAADRRAPPLQQCPLWAPRRAPAEQLARGADWLAAEWLGAPVGDTLRRHQAAPVDWVADWAAQGRTWPARVLHAVHMQLPPGVIAAPQSRLDPRQASQAHELARCMRNEPIFCRLPDLHGTVPDTGPWNRLATQANEAAPALGAWHRIAARWVDLLRVLHAEAPAALSHGAHALGTGQALSWVETARGLLLHRVALEAGPSGPRVADYRVVAPTDWNFHPRGVLAGAIARLSPEAGHTARWLAAAFDPCVPARVQPSDEPAEVDAHA